MKQSPEVSSSTSAVSLEQQVVLAHQPMVDLKEKGIILLISAVSKACHKRYLDERNQYVAEAVARRSRLPELVGALLSRTAMHNFSESVGREFLQLAKDSTNPVVSTTIVSWLREITKLPLMMNPEIIGNARTIRDEWEKIMLRHNGLFGYYVNLLDASRNLDDVLHNGVYCDKLLRTLCCLKIVYDLHKQSFEAYLVKFLTTAAAVQLHNASISEDAPAQVVTFGNLTTGDTQIQEMMSTIFSTDTNANLIFNVAYFNQVTQLIQNCVPFDHMQNTHKAGSCRGYQVKMFNTAITELRESGILSAEEESNARRKYSSMWC